VQLFHEAAGEYPKLAELIASARERLITAPALICDVFWSFYNTPPRSSRSCRSRRAPASREHSRTPHGDPRVERGTRSRTIGDVFNSAVATIGAAENALSALSAAVVAEINHLQRIGERRS